MSQAQRKTRCRDDGEHASGVFGAQLNRGNFLGCDFGRDAVLILLSGGLRSASVISEDGDVARWTVDRIQV